MKKILGALAASAVVLVCSASGAIAQAEDGSGGKTGISMAGNFGFAANQDGGNVQLGFEAPFEVNENCQIGPWLTIGLADDWVLISATLNTRYLFDVFESGKLRRLRPFVQGGLGISHYDIEVGPVDDDDTGFLINMGLGAEYAVSEDVAIGSNMMFNTVPTFTPDQAFYFSWQFVQVRYRF
jgi:opacity protein-like surface antigen